MNWEMSMGDRWGDDDGSVRVEEVRSAALRIHECGHKPFIGHLQWYLAWSRCSERGKDEREPLSEPLFALPTILLFAPDVYVIELVSVHPFVVQPGSSCPETYCFVLLRTVLPCFGTSPRISIASMSA